MEKYLILIMKFLNLFKSPVEVENQNLKQNQKEKHKEQVRISVVKLHFK